MTQSKIRQWIASDVGTLVLVAGARFLFHMFTNGRYGFHRDELLTFDNARHLAWGYAVYPPVTPLLARIELEIFGTALIGFRCFAALSQALAMLFTGLSARAMGAGRFAQLVAALAVAVSGHALVSGWFLSYSSFDYLWWVLVSYFAIRLLTSGDSRWWLGIGAAIGIGMLTKYTMGFLALGVAGGTILTPARRYLRTPWLWCGAAVALLLMLPHLLWQMEHHFVALDFLRSIHARDVRWGWTDYFLPNQLWKTTNPVTIPLWGAGLWYLFADLDGRRYRMLGWMYVLPLLALLLARGRDYYLAAAYPMLFAAGAAWGEKWLRSLNVGAANTVRHAACYTLGGAFLCTAAITVPLAPVASHWFHVANQVNGGNFGYQLGWPELVRTVASVRDSLPLGEQATVAILAQDDGESGAIRLYGPAYHLPAAISPMNSNWYRGYGDPPPETVITLGYGREFLEESFESCELAARLSFPSGLRNNAIGSDSIYVCRRLRQPWPEFWKRVRSYG